MKSKAESSTSDRYLVVHPDPEIRQMVAQAMARAVGPDLAVYETEFPAAAAGACRQLRPKAVLLDVGESPELSIDVVRSLHGQGHHVIALYNPTTVVGEESRFLRAVTRAGARDFVTLPPSDHEVRSALDSIDSRMEPGESKAADGHIVCFLSHKGGAGTSTLALATAATLAEESGAEDVALLDADLQFGDVAGLAGLEGRSGMLDLLNQLQTAGPLEPYLQREPLTGLHVLASPDSILDAEKIGPAQLSRILLALSRRFNTVVVDLPRVIDLNTLAVLDLAETIFLVTEPAPSCLDRASQLIDLLQNQGYSSKRLHVVLNQPVESSGGYLGQTEVSRVFDCEIDALIVHDPKNLEAVSRDRSLPTSRSRSPIGLGARELANIIRENRN